MNRYTTHGMRAVRAESFGDAAEIFGERLARRQYGRRGCLGCPPRLDSWTQSGSSATYQVFVGRPVPGERGTVSGHNVWLYISREEA